jgi:hypothetical protein
MGANGLGDEARSGLGEFCRLYTGLGDRDGLVWVVVPGTDPGLELPCLALGAL